MAEERKIIPMDKLVNTDKNMYELTNAAIHRAHQIAISGSDNDIKGKVISQAIGDIVEEDVRYEYKR